MFVKPSQKSGECHAVGLTSSAAFKEGWTAAGDSTGASFWPSRYTGNKYVTLWAEVFQNQLRESVTQLGFDNISL